MKEDKTVQEPSLRTEEEKLTQAPLIVILGGKEYEIKPLVIKDSRGWRGKVGPWQAALSKYANMNADNPEGFEKALADLLTNRIDQTIEYFFEYAKELPREEIEATATDSEILKAFNEVFKIAFPFE